MFPLFQNTDIFRNKFTAYLRQFDINSEIPIEPDFRFHLMKFLMDNLNENKGRFDEISIFLERNKFDLVIFYKKDNKKFAEAIELKRGAKDKKELYEQTSKNDYFLNYHILTKEEQSKLTEEKKNEIAIMTIAKDLYKIISSVSLKKNIAKKRADYKPSQHGKGYQYPLIAGHFILLCPNEKYEGKNKGWIDREYRKDIVNDGFVFWKMEEYGMNYIQNRLDSKLNIEYEPFDLKNQNQETKEFICFFTVSNLNL